MVNKVLLIGNVGGDPEVRQLPSGNWVANVTLATSENWKDRQTGERQERTEWHRLVFFGRLAEVVGQYVRKGSKLYVEGRLQTREWEKDGVKRYTTEIVIDQRGQMQMLDRRPNEGQYQQAPAQQQYQQQAPAQQQYQQAQQHQAPVAQMPPEYDGGGGFDDDIPFAKIPYLAGI